MPFTGRTLGQRSRNCLRLHRLHRPSQTRKRLGDVGPVPTYLTTLAHSPQVMALTNTDLGLAPCPVKVWQKDKETGRVVTFWSYCRRALCTECRVRRTNLMMAMLFDQIMGRPCWHVT